MTIRHLKILISVCDHMSMSGAAKSLFVSQPTVSQAILELEKYYGIKIFERLAKKLYITATGQEMLEYSKHIINSFNEMEERIKSKKMQKLRIGATITIATCVLNPLLDSFSHECPDSNFYIYVDNTNIIEEMLLRNELDIGLTEGELKNDNIQTISVFEDELVLVCGCNHPFYNRDKVGVEDLRDQDFILGRKGSGNRDLLNSKFTELAIDINEKWTCNSSEAIKNAVMESKYLTVISKMLVETEAANHQLRIIPINNTQFTRTFHLAYHKNKYLSDNMKQFVAAVKTISYANGTMKRRTC